MGCVPVSAGAFQSLCGQCIMLLQLNLWRELTHISASGSSAEALFELSPLDGIGWLTCKQLCQEKDLKESGGGVVEHCLQFDP